MSTAPDPGAEQEGGKSAEETVPVSISPEILLGGGGNNKQKLTA